MMRRFTEDASRIFLACGPTDFRKQIPRLIATVTLQFDLDPYNGSCVFIFCNKKRDSIKVLRYDENGFVLGYKKVIVSYEIPVDKNSERSKGNFIPASRMALAGLRN